MRKGVAFGFLVVVLTFTAPAFALVVTPSNPFTCIFPGGCFDITGVISAKDFDDMTIIADRQAAIAQSVGRIASQFFVRLDSEGGDIDAAIAMGRLLRRQFATVVITSSAKCFSACVYLLAGAIQRIVSGRVGIHRPYSQRTDARNYDTIQKEQKRIAVLSKAYLDEMNLPTSLYDAMVRTPPENIRILSEEELAEFGLAQEDPISEEMGDNYDAQKYGLSKMEFLRRKAMVDIQCTQHLSPGDWVLCKERVLSDAAAESHIPLDTILAELSNAVNAGGPIMFNEQIRRDTSVPGPGKRITYFYTVLPYSSTDLEPSSFLAVFTPLMKKYNCGVTISESYFQRGVSFVHVFRGNDAHEIGRVTVTREDCRGDLEAEIFAPAPRGSGAQ